MDCDGIIGGTLPEIPDPSNTTWEERKALVIVTKWWDTKFRYHRIIYFVYPISSLTVSPYFLLRFWT